MSGTWAPGPQELTSIVVGGQTINGQFIENFSVSTEGQSYDSAAGMPVDRGFVTRSITFDAYDYSKVSAVNTLMTNRSLNTITENYVDGDASVITSQAIVRVMPIVSVVPDACQVYINTYSSNDSTKWNSVSSGFTDLGIAMSEPTFTFEFPFDGTDGCGRPYFGGSVRVTAEFELAGIRGATTDIRASLESLGFGANVDVAVKLPSDNYMCLQNMYAYFYFGPESSSGPRTVSLKLVGTAATWASLLGFTGEAADATMDGWGTETQGYDPGNYFGGMNVEIVATDYSESALIAW